MQNEEMLEEILSYYEKEGAGIRQEVLVEMLREIQEVYGCITAAVQEKAADRLHVKRSVIENLIRLYPSLKAEKSRHTITVCTGRQCQMKGGIAVLEAIEKELGIGPGETTEDGNFTLTKRSCLKHCRMAPNMMIDDELYTFVKPGDIGKILKKYVMIQP